jgi:hypothetical protein
MKFLERRVQDSKNESPNSLPLDFTLAFIGFICGIAFNFALFNNLIIMDFRYFHVGVIANTLLTFLFIKLDKARKIKTSRFKYSSLMIQMGWISAIYTVDLFI